eukprot:SAG11_NODE_27432_length_332_cov_3.442060_1_plen_68_part_01
MGVRVPGTTGARTQGYKYCRNTTFIGLSVLVITGHYVTELTHHCLDRLRLTKAPHRQLRVICAIHYLS